MGIRNPLIDVTGRSYRGETPSMVNSLTFSKDNRYALGIGAVVVVAGLAPLAVLVGILIDIIGLLLIGTNFIQVDRTFDFENEDE